MTTTTDEQLVESGTVCFQIDGEYLTDLARDLVTESKWRHALRILMEGVQGFGYSDALAILRGESKLVGMNSLDLVAEDRTEKRDAYLKLLTWQYEGCWQRPDGMWQPYANVTSFCIDDIPSGISSRLCGQFGINPRWANARVLYYADDPYRDRVFEEHDIGEKYSSVIWRRIDDPPLWLEGNKSPQVALASFEAAGRRLEVRGASELFDHSRSYSDVTFGHHKDEQDESVSTDIEEIDRIAPGARFGYLEELARDTLGEKGIEALQAIMGTQQDMDEPPEHDPDCESEGGYILPNGHFYGCGYMGHADLALRLLRLVFKVEQPSDPQKEADRRNWLRIQPSALEPSKFAVMSPKGRPTKAQKKTLVDWCIRHQQPYPEDLK